MSKMVKDFNIEIDKKLYNELYSIIRCDESQNVKTRQYSDSDMVKKISNLILTKVKNSYKSKEDINEI